MWVSLRGVRRMNHSIRHPGSIDVEISPHNIIGIRLQIREKATRSQLIAGTPKVSPETVGNARAVELFRKPREPLLPMRQSCCAISLLVVHKSKAVINVGAAR